MSNKICTGSSILRSYSDQRALVGDGCSLPALQHARAQLLREAGGGAGVRGAELPGRLPPGPARPGRPVSQRFGRQLRLFHRRSHSYWMVAFHKAVMLPAATSAAGPPGDDGDLQRGGGGRLHSGDSGAAPRLGPHRQVEPRVTKQFNLSLCAEITAYWLDTTLLCSN